MDCPHGHSAQTLRVPRTTGLGYAVFGCTDCGCTFHARTGTPFNSLEGPTDLGFHVRFCRRRYPLSYQETAELFRRRGCAFTEEPAKTEPGQGDGRVAQR